ncbi:MAG: serine--tRNA ligase [Bradymonadia bacterium]
MLDLRQLSRDAEAFVQQLTRRGEGLDLSEVVALDAERRSLIQSSDALRHRQKEAQKAMGKADKQSEAFIQFREEMKAVSNEIKESAERLRAVEEQLKGFMMQLPNVPAAECPDGKDESENVVVSHWGEKPAMDFEPKAHWDVAEGLGILDFERGTKITGARFTVYKGLGARLERALIQFMLDLHTEEGGYTEILPPFLVSEDSMLAAGQFPKFREDAFETAKDGFVLVPTAEVPLTNLHRDEILTAEQLPVRYAAYTPCFRREAGSHGRDTRGLIRQHQFQKVELYHFCSPEDSVAEHTHLLKCAEEVLRRLNLHYRVVDLCTGDLGFGANRTYDLEVWLPGMQAYREISSCSNCGDFQARRAAIRYRAPDAKKPVLVHTLNGSGLAVGRTVVAILENYQRADGSVEIPEALRPYMRADEIPAP